MATALANLGFAADYFAPTENPTVFRARIASYLRSKLPVVLLIKARSLDAGHAVTVTGYAEPTQVVEVPAPDAQLNPLPMRDASLSVLYVHDDNLGSHAHYEISDGAPDSEGRSELILLRGNSGTVAPPWWTPDEWIVEAALVPKPNKLRMPIDDLFGIAWGLRPSVELILPGLSLDYAVFSTTGVEYLRCLRGLGFIGTDLAQIYRHLDLPRYIGVVRVSQADVHICDFVVDMTQIALLQDGRGAALACVAPEVPQLSLAWKNLDAFCRYLEIPLLAKS